MSYELFFGILISAIFGIPALFVILVLATFKLAEAIVERCTHSEAETE